MEGTERHRGGSPAEATKPPELIALADEVGTLFDLMKSWFGVGDTVVLDLATISSAAVAAELTNPTQVAAMAMRKLQAIHLTAQPGFHTKPAIVLSLIESVLPALIEAPSSRLRSDLAETDWDLEWLQLDEGLMWRPAPGPWTREQLEGPVAMLFRAARALHEQLIRGNPTIC